MNPLKFHRVWKIDNFSETYKNMTKHPMIVSNEYSPPSLDKYIFALQLYPNGVNDETKEYVSAYVYLESSLKEEVRTLFRIAVLDNSWQLVNVKGTNLEESNYWGYRDFILRKDLENFLQENGTLLLFWEVEVILDLSISDAELSELNASFQSSTPIFESHKWSDYFNALPNCLTTAYQWKIKRFSARRWDDTIATDVAVICDDDTTHYKFHLTLFSKGKKESVKNRVSLAICLDCHCPLPDGVCANVKVYIEKADGKLCNIFCNQHCFLKSSSWELDKIITHSEWIANKKQYLPKDTLTLFIVIQILLDKNLTITEKENYKQLFYRKEFSSSRVSISK